MNEPLLPESPSVAQTICTDDGFDVKKRLDQLRTWQSDWERADLFLAQRLSRLDTEKEDDLQRGIQIGSIRKRLRLHLVRQPLEVSPVAIRKMGYSGLRNHLVRQFVELPKTERLLWLNNFLFIITPDLRCLSDKISQIRTYRSFGQQRNFLLGGHSGTGKTTFLDWLTLNEQPTVQSDHNHVPIIKIDAPVSNRTPRPLFQRILMECGTCSALRNNEEILLMKLGLMFQRCGVEMLIVDEVEHIVRPELRRRLLEISNMTRGIPIICASCHPLRWIEGDAEVQGRWNDYFELQQYTGQRLQQLLAFLELLLPFPAPSFLAAQSTGRDVKSEEHGEGSATMIEQWTGGILRDIMILILDASARAIQQGLPNLPPSLLQETWKRIQTRQVTDFLTVLQNRENPK